MLYLVIDTIIVHFTIGYNIQKPYLFQHVVLGFMPEYFRTQGDLIYAFGIPMNIFIYYHLLCGKYPHLNYILFPSYHNARYSSIFKQKINRKSPAKKLRLFFGFS